MNLMPTLPICDIPTPAGSNCTQPTVSTAPPSGDTTTTVTLPICDIPTPAGSNCTQPTAPTAATTTTVGTATSPSTLPQTGAGTTVGGFALVAILVGFTFRRIAHGGQPGAKS